MAQNDQQNTGFNYSLNLENNSNNNQSNIQNNNPEYQQQQDSILRSSETENPFEQQQQVEIEQIQEQQLTEQSQYQQQQQEQYMQLIDRENNNMKKDQCFKNLKKIQEKSALEINYLYFCFFLGAIVMIVYFSVQKSILTFQLGPWILFLILDVFRILQLKKQISLGEKIKQKLEKTTNIQDFFEPSIIEQHMQKIFDENNLSETQINMETVFNNLSKSNIQPPQKVLSFDIQNQNSNYPKTQQNNQNIQQNSSLQENLLHNNNNDQENFQYDNQVQQQQFQQNELLHVILQTAPYNGLSSEYQSSIQNINNVILRCDKKLKIWKEINVFFYVLIYLYGVSAIIWWTPINNEALEIFIFIYLGFEMLAGVLTTIYVAFIIAVTVFLVVVTLLLVPFFQCLAIIQRKRKLKKFQNLKLKTKKFTQIKSEILQDLEECSICLEKYVEEDELVVLQCGEKNNVQNQGGDLENKFRSFVGFNNNNSDIEQQQNLQNSTLQRNNSTQKQEEPKEIQYNMHAFHQDCLKNWFKENLKCPLCRHEVEIEKYIK